MVSYGSGNAAKESIEYDKKQFNKENGSKKWIVLNWGKPDSIENHGALIYYIYSRKSKDAPDYYRLQSDFKAGPVKLGFKGNRLVEIQAYWPDRAYKGQKVVILNP